MGIRIANLNTTLCDTPQLCWVSPLRQIHPESRKRNSGSEIVRHSPDILSPTPFWSLLFGLHSANTNPYLCPPAFSSVECSSNV